MQDDGKKKEKSHVLHFLGVCVATVLATGSCSQNPERATWQYRQLVETIESGQVEEITISSDRTRALVTTNDGQQAVVDLPADPELNDSLLQNNVTVSVAPQTDSSAILAILVYLAIPLTIFAFWLWTLVDCAMNETNEGNTKLVWVLIILFVSIFGSLVYFFVRRPQRIRELGR